MPTVVDRHLELGNATLVLGGPGQAVVRCAIPGRIGLHKRITRRLVVPSQRSRSTKTGAERGRVSP